ncbi:MAG TPA: hypothetical protein VFN38_09255 [Gemmatimonadaceae bacterium]|nr:hypothetical protein [Gemmatimonadaceae bacterium]
MLARSRNVFTLALALSVASVVIASPARAQDAALAPAPATTPVAPQPATAPAPAGPTMEAAAVGVRHAPVTSSTTTAPRGGYGQPVALMVVGGAAVLVGLIIGNGAGAAIAVGGAVIGLVGLYQYLQ